MASRTRRPGLGLGFWGEARVRVLFLRWMEAERAARSRAMELSWRKKESPVLKSMPRSDWMELVRVRVLGGLGLRFLEGRERGEREREREKEIEVMAGE